MARGKKHSPEQVVNLLRQLEVSVANGKTTSLASKEGGITDQTYYRWRKEYLHPGPPLPQRLSSRRILPLPPPHHAHALRAADSQLRSPSSDRSSASGNESEEEPIECITLDSEGAILAPQRQFLEPEEPEQQSSFLSRLLENMEQHQQIVLAQNRINELEARLSAYETVTPTKLDLNASEETDAPYRAASSPAGGPHATQSDAHPQPPVSEKKTQSLNVAGQRSSNRRERRANLRAQRLHGRHRAQPHQRRHQRILDQVLTGLIPNQPKGNTLYRFPALPRFRQQSRHRHARPISPNCGQPHHRGSTLVPAIPQKYADARSQLYGTG